MFGVVGRKLRECSSRNWRLEIDTGVEGDRSIATRSGDAAKTGGINVRRWVANRSHGSHGQVPFSVLRPTWMTTISKKWRYMPASEGHNNEKRRRDDLAAARAV